MGNAYNVSDGKPWKTQKQMGGNIKTGLKETKV
jgi:hypothetical protein